MSENAASAPVEVSVPPQQTVTSNHETLTPPNPNGPDSSTRPPASQLSTTTPDEQNDPKDVSRGKSPQSDPDSNVEDVVKQAEDQLEQQAGPNANESNDSAKTDTTKPETTHSTTTTTKPAGPSTSEAADAAVTAVAEALSEADSIPEPKVSQLDSKEIELSSADVAELLGQDSAATFRRAMALTLASGLAEVGGGVAVTSNEDKAGVMLQEATRLFVLLLTSVPDEAQDSAGFAELLTGYGKSLLGFVRKAGQRQGVLGAKAKGDADPAEEDLEDEDDNEELAWTQLEAARVAFERLVKGGADRFNSRLGDVHSCLGDLLLEGDAWEAASREYDNASTLLSGRRKAEVLYKQYLAMRRDAAVKAVEALKESVRAFEDADSDEETIKELREELSGFEEAIMPAVTLLKQGEKRAGEVKEATVVQPRKRAKKDK